MRRTTRATQHHPRALSELANCKCALSIRNLHAGLPACQPARMPAIPKAGTLHGSRGPYHTFIRETKSCKTCPTSTSTSICQNTDSTILEGMHKVASHLNTMLFGFLLELCRTGYIVRDHLLGTCYFSQRLRGCLTVEEATLAITISFWVTSPMPQWMTWMPGLTATCVLYLEGADCV